VVDHRRKVCAKKVERNHAGRHGSLFFFFPWRARFYRLPTTAGRWN
jgi:hypothetical protein